MTVGREGDVLVADDLVSRLHLRLEPVDDGVLVTDLGSSNGVALNNPGAVVTEATVRLGDKLLVGSSVLTVVASPGVEAGVTRRIDPLDTVPMSSSPVLPPPASFAHGRQAPAGWWQASDGQWYPPSLQPGSPSHLPPPPSGLPSAPRLDEGARTALVLSIVGILLCGPFGAAAALYEASRARKRIQESNGMLTGEGVVLAATIIALVFLVIWLYAVLELISAPRATTPRY